MNSGVAFSASEIIPNQLYLGNLIDAVNHKELKKRNIKYLVTAIHSMPNLFEDDGPNTFNTVSTQTNKDSNDSWWVRVPILDHEEDSVSRYFDTLNAWINNRIENKLNHHEDHDLLKKSGIDSFPFPLDGIPMHNISLEDKATETVSITANAEGIFKPAESEPGAVLIHCIQGKSRSASLVIAYIMWSEKLTFDQAYEFVKSKRPLVRPNPTFERELRFYENILKSRGYYETSTKPITASSQEQV